MELADRLLDRVVRADCDLEQDAELGIVLDRALPGVEAVDRRDLRARRQAALDQRARDPARLVAVADVVTTRRNGAIASLTRGGPAYSPR